ncbi:MAG TPA: hypothetical protein VGQ59_01000 [Cyclobacteriaceae bacterium]|jgi:hypothetical protein|nr:hypothetical protein [Cyclobacteriaceae bacterium]
MNCNEYKPHELGPLGKNIKTIILQSTDFIVFLDEDETIEWSTEDDYSGFHTAFGSVQNRISHWESLCNKLFSKKEAYDYKAVLAEGYARILDDKDINLANDVLDLTIYRIKKHGKEILKQYYILSCFICTLLVISAIAIVIIQKKECLMLINEDNFQILLTSLFGGIGAFVFATLRLTKYEPELTVPVKIYIIDGMLRVFYGIIAGMIVAIGIKSNLVLGIINQVKVPSIYLTVFIGLIAGASEFIIPNLIKQVESKSSIK